MIYLKEFDTHASYESELNGVRVDFKIPNVSYCKDVKDVHFNPYNLIKFYVGEITTPQTVKIYTDLNTSVDIQVSESNKWYSYVLPKDKGLCKIEGDSVKKVVVKADISYKPNFRPPFYYGSIIPTSTVEASFKGSKLNITDIKGIFQSCYNLTSLDLSGLNTSNVTNMVYMFYSCRGLTSLDVSKFDTSNVTDMGSMFDGCTSLSSLDLSNFNTSKVTDMSYMFRDCRNLTSLDVSNFNTSNVTNMNYMFSNCNSLTSLTLSNFNTRNVTSMSNMFVGCSGLISLDLSGWVMSNVTTSINTMFENCNSLRTIKMVGCSEDTVNKIKAHLTTDGIINNVTIVTK